MVGSGCGGEAGGRQISIQVHITHYLLFWRHPSQWRPFRQWSHCSAVHYVRSCGFICSGKRHKTAQTDAWDKRRGGGGRGGGGLTKENECAGATGAAEAQKLYINYTYWHCCTLIPYISQTLWGDRKGSHVLWLPAILSLSSRSVKTWVMFWREAWHSSVGT